MYATDGEYSGLITGSEIKGGILSSIYNKDGDSNYIYLNGSFYQENYATVNKEPYKKFTHTLGIVGDDWPGIGLNGIDEYDNYGITIKTERYDIQNDLNEGKSFIELKGLSNCLGFKNSAGTMELGFNLDNSDPNITLTNNYEKGRIKIDTSKIEIITASSNLTMDSKIFILSHITNGEGRGTSTIKFDNDLVLNSSTVLGTYYSGSVISLSDFDDNAIKFNYYEPINITSDYNYKSEIKIEGRINFEDAEVVGLDIDTSSKPVYAILA